jgi:hypothetical protein
MSGISLWDVVAAVQDESQDDSECVAVLLHLLSDSDAPS